MATTSVAQLLAGIDGLSLTAPRDGFAGMTFRGVLLNGQPLRVKLADDMKSITLPFAPSVFKGNGDEPRKGIVFSVLPQVVEAMAELEDACRQMLEESCPRVQALWCSCIKPGDKYASTLKAKINVAGPKPANFYNVACEAVPPPVEWQRLPVNAVIEVRGCYIQRQSIGVMLEVTDLQYGELARERCPF